MTPRIAAILVFTVCLVAQERRTRRENVSVVRAHPGVVLQYQRSGHREPVFNDESSNGIWLALRNNMKVPIYVRGFHTRGRGGGLSLLHEVVPTASAPLREVGIPREGTQPNTANRATVSIIPRGYDDQHVSSVVSVSPGDSLSFSFPAEHLMTSHYIRVRFVYDWELKTESREPQHFVSFGFEELPTEERLKLPAEAK